MRKLSICLALCSLVACNRSGGAESNATESASRISTPPVASNGVSSDQPAAHAPDSPSSGSTPNLVTTNPPESFANGTKESIGGAVGLGCEARSLDGWLELLCRRRNGTGGRPVRAGPPPVVAVVEAPGNEAPAGSSADLMEELNSTVLPNERGELRLVLPFRNREKQDIEITWTDVRYTLKIDGTKGAFEWAGVALPHRRACQALLDENRSVLAAAQKVEGTLRLAPAEIKGLSKLGVCQPAGLGSWALSLERASGAGEPSARRVELEIEVVRIDLEGKRLSAPFGTFAVAAGGFELSTLVAYDYDDDGNDELVVPYEIKALPASRIAPALPAVWSFSATAIAPYARAPSLSGSVGVEHLDSDMRPDLATYGAFLGWFDADCGAKVCPPRISGPRFFFHSLADGGFSNDDEAARAALKRGCGGKAAPLVSANLEKTAKNLVCARASGSPVDAVRAELDSEAAGLCSGSSSCTVSKVLGSWLSAPLPVTIEGRVGPSTPARPPTP